MREMPFSDHVHRKVFKMAGGFSQAFQQAFLTLAGAIAQQQSISVASNIGGTSEQSVLVASTASNSTGIDALTTPASSPAATTMSATRTSSNRCVYIKTRCHTVNKLLVPRPMRMLL